MSTRKNFQMVATVVLLAIAASCSLFEKELETPFSFELRMDRPADAPLQFSVLKDVDARSGEIGKYTGDINVLEIQSVTYRVKDFTGRNNPVISGNLEFAPAGSSAFHVLGAIINLDLRTVAASATGHTLEIKDAAAREQLAKLLHSGQPITFRLNASTSNNPVAATLAVAVNTKLTVEL